MVAGDISFQILLLSSGLAYKIGYRFSILVRLHVFWIERKTLLLMPVVHYYRQLKN